MPFKETIDFLPSRCLRMALIKFALLKTSTLESLSSGIHFRSISHRGDSFSCTWWVMVGWWIEFLHECVCTFLLPFPLFTSLLSVMYSIFLSWHLRFMTMSQADLAFNGIVEYAIRARCALLCDDSFFLSIHFFVPHLNGVADLFWNHLEWWLLF